MNEKMNTGQGKDAEQNAREKEGREAFERLQDAWKKVTSYGPEFSNKLLQFFLTKSANTSEREKWLTEELQLQSALSGQISYEQSAFIFSTHILGVTSKFNPADYVRLLETAVASFGEDIEIPKDFQKDMKIMSTWITR